jgi:hypothetical protein
MVYEGKFPSGDGEAAIDIWKNTFPEWFKNEIFPSGERYTKENFLMGKVKLLEIYR